MEEVVGIAKVWSVILVGFFNPPTTADNPGPFVDVNYKTTEQCDTVRSELLVRYPNAQIWCIETFKPDSAPKRKRVRTARRR